MPIEIIHADCLEASASLAENSISAIITDPPYNLISISQRYGRLFARPAKPGVFDRVSKGFAGQAWDTDIAFRVETWTAMLRVLKPGAFIACFGSPRTFHRMATAMEDAGFEIRDTLMWLYAQGFPKMQWLKPAFEPIVLARKPCEGSRRANVEQWGVGMLNIDECRIPIEPGTKLTGGLTSSGKPTCDRSNEWHRPWMEDVEACAIARDKAIDKVRKAEELGRYPCNLLHDGSDELLELLGDKARFYVCPKARRGERKGDHPTQKPVELIRWLVRLLCPAGGTILDPFAGSGTTGEAAALEGRSAILIEREAKYISDIQQRLALFTEAGFLTV